MALKYFFIPIVEDPQLFGWMEYLFFFPHKYNYIVATHKHNHNVLKEERGSVTDFNLKV